MKEESLLWRYSCAQSKLQIRNNVDVYCEYNFELKQFGSEMQMYIILTGGGVYKLQLQPAPFEPVHVKCKI